MVVTSPESEKVKNPLDDKMTRAQIARRKFKSALPRKAQNRRPSTMEALGELFTLFDRFRSVVAEQGQDPDALLHAALAYHLPKSDPATVAHIATLPYASEVGKFCDEVMKLDRPEFLGVVFVQVDPDADKQEYKAVSFCVPFSGAPEDAGRLLTAQKVFLHKIQEVIKGLRK